MIINKVRYIVLLPLLFLFSSCAKKSEEMAADNNKGTYPSIKSLGMDQYNLFHDQPLTFTRYISLNGKKDSSIVNSEQIDWGAIFKLFFATDISDKKFLNHYKFTMFDDDMTHTRNFYYEAQDDNLFTRVFQISADNVTMKIKSVYVQTEKKSFWGEQSQKLYYKPWKLIQIQEYQKNLIGPAKELITEYRFF